MATAVRPETSSPSIPTVTDTSAGPPRSSQPDAGRRGRWFWWLTLAGAAVTYLVIVAGSVVRVTGSGLGCGPDWPTCNGRIVPAPELATIIEFSHRLLAALDSVVIFAVPAAAWLWRRRPRERHVLVPATSIPILLAVQLLLGMIVVRLDLAPMAVLVHLGFAMLILGGMVWLAVQAKPSSQFIVHSSQLALGRHYRWLVTATAAAVFGLILTGAYTRATGAGPACLGFPGCSVPAEAVQALQSSGSPDLVRIQLFHRFAAYVVILLVAATVAETWRLTRVAGDPPDSSATAGALRIAAGLLACLLFIQSAIGAAMVTNGLPTVLRGAHVAGAAAVWAATVLLAALVWPSGQRARPSDRGDNHLRAAPPIQNPRSKIQNHLLAYLSLTKPKVILLLEVPTLAAMLVAGPALPSPLLVIATLLGGAFAAGGAAAINAYMDRDIDPLMGERTRRRAIPSGAVSPAAALAFGLTLALLSFVVLWAFANFLAASLAQVALLVYVFVYTYWLKRATPSNIVIGGAAGAIPPLVGWAAVTGTLGPAAWLLFLVIFFWTPPHFWALSLLIKQHYARAKVPMLPVVRGEAETRRQIVYYTLQMICVTVLIFAFRLSGFFYLVSALALGGVFLYLATQLWRQATARAASRLFHYSMLYLWLLSAALVVDKRVFG